MYNSYNAMFEGRGRPQKYGEPTGTTSVRLSHSDLNKLDKLCSDGFDVSRHLHNVINRRQR